MSVPFNPSSSFIGPIRPNDPSSNNMPLQFDSSKGKPPMPVASEASKRSQKDKDASKDDAPTSTTPASGPGVGLLGSMPGAGFMGVGGMGFPGPMLGPGDPSSMMMMAQMGQMGFNQFGGFMGPMGPMGPMSEMPKKDIIKLQSCTLYPPPPGAPLRSTRDRPPWCKTIFIGGTPEKATEEMIREIFEGCGPILNIRLNKKNFAHVRFASEDCVDRALFFSGYRMKIENSDEKEMTGRLHVDFAEARDDQFDWECQQRIIAREMRHRQRMEEEQMRPPSPPPITHYNEHEASLLSDKLKDGESFSRATQVLITWLDRGECTRRSASAFFTLLQSTNTNVRRLMGEKETLELELAMTKNRVQQGFSNILCQFDQVDKVFAAALKQKCWDHFSKAQRKSIDTWYKSTKKIHSAQREALLNERQEDEMDLSDDEDKDAESGAKRRKMEYSGSAPITPMSEEDLIARSREYAKHIMGSLPSSSSDGMKEEDKEEAELKEENDALKCQVEAYKNEIDLVKQEYQALIDAKDKQIRDLQNALQGMQQQLIRVQQQARQAELEAERQSAAATAAASIERREIMKARKISDKSDELSEKESSEHPEGEEEKAEEEEEEKDREPEVVKPKMVVRDDSVSSTGVNLTINEAHILGLVSCFLNVHPMGASLDYVWSYLSQLMPLGAPLRTRELEDLLERLPGLFREEVCGVGANLERRWHFVGYSPRKG